MNKLTINHYFNGFNIEMTYESNDEFVEGNMGITISFNGTMLYDDAYYFIWDQFEGTEDYTKSIEKFKHVF